MKETGSIELFRYWNRLRKGRVAPKRSEVEPADIRKLLADTFILEQSSREEGVFRLAGTRLCSTFGRELKGTAFPSLWRARDQRLVAKMVRNTFTGGSVVLMEYQGISQKGRACPFELLLLPLDGGENSLRCLGINSPAMQPFWLGADPLIESSLESVRVIDPDREPLFLGNRPSVPVPPLAPQARDVTPASAPTTAQGRRVGHLLVFDGGRGGSDN